MIPNSRKYAITMIPCGTHADAMITLPSGIRADALVDPGDAWPLYPDRLYNLEDVVCYTPARLGVRESDAFVRLVAPGGPLDEELLRRACALPIRFGDGLAIWGTPTAVGVLVDLVTMTPGIDPDELRGLQAAARNFPRR